MTTFAVLATGPSMSQAVANSVRDLPTVAVNDAFRLAPWARAMAAQDFHWWQANPDAFEFKGMKYSAQSVPGTIRIMPSGPIETQSNSGLLGIHVATLLGATRVLLFGFDMRGSHYFGQHKGLPNTSEKRFEDFKAQFAAYAKRTKAEIVNCTPESALTCFPMEVACHS